MPEVTLSSQDSITDKADATDGKSVTVKWTDADGNSHSASSTNSTIIETAEKIKDKDYLNSIKHLVHIEHTGEVLDSISYEAFKQ